MVDRSFKCLILSASIIILSPEAAAAKLPKCTFTQNAEYEDFYHLLDKLSTAKCSGVAPNLKLDCECNSVYPAMHERLSALIDCVDTRGQYPLVHAHDFLSLRVTECVAAQAEYSLYRLSTNPMCLESDLSAFQSLIQKKYTLQTALCEKAADETSCLCRAVVPKMKTQFRTYANKNCSDLSHTSIDYSTVNSFINGLVTECESTFLNYDPNSPTVDQMCSIDEAKEFQRYDQNQTSDFQARCREYPSEIISNEAKVCKCEQVIPLWQLRLLKLPHCVPSGEAPKMRDIALKEEMEDCRTVLPDYDVDNYIHETLRNPLTPSEATATNHPSQPEQSQVSQPNLDVQARMSPSSRGELIDTSISTNFTLHVATLFLIFVTSIWIV